MGAACVPLSRLGKYVVEAAQAAMWEPSGQVSRGCERVGSS